MKTLFFALSFFLIIAQSAYAAEPGQTSVANVYDANGNITTTFVPFTTAPGTIGSVVTGDLGTDNVAEILIGAGADMKPEVTIFRQDGSFIGSFMAYAKEFRGGVNVAVCDVDGDGAEEIITGAKFGGGPHIRIFDSMGKLKYAGFFAYASDFRGGVNVACGDLDNDGTAEIVTGAGLTGGPHIRVYSYNGTMLAETFHGSAAQNVGTYVRIENGTILTANIAGNDHEIATFDYEHGTLTAVTATTNRTSDDLMEYAALGHGRYVIANITSELFSDTSEKYILVDLSEQTLTAYAYGIQVNKFLISTGVAGHATPAGKTTVREKLLWHDYVWSYGSNHPDNYNIPNVKYNLRIYDHIYIHYAYWHNNFGHRMSHGCVNVNYENSEWIFNWADVGTPVEIVE